MKVVILAGGFGSRISEESIYRPKPMIEIGDMPMLWHVMKNYSHYGFNEFIICAGYKQHVIKEWFSDYFLYTSDVTFDFTRGNELIVHDRRAESWKVTIVDTGLNTQTGGRVKRVQRYLGREPFMLAYGDGVGDLDIPAILRFHEAHGRIATLSMYAFSQYKGVLETGADGLVTAFREKSDIDGNLINIGYMVFQPEIFDFIDGDDTLLEKDALTRLAAEGQLAGYVHRGFWQCVDTLREKNLVEQLWRTGAAPWKIW